MRAATAAALAALLLLSGCGKADPDQEAAKRLAEGWCLPRTTHVDATGAQLDTEAQAWGRCVARRTPVELARIKAQHNLDQHRSDLERAGE